MARVVETLTAQALHNDDDIDTPCVTLNGVEWEVTGSGEVFTTNEYLSLTLLNETESSSWVINKMAHTEQDETFSTPGILVWLKQGDCARWALVNREVELEVSSVA